MKFVQFFMSAYACTLFRSTRIILNSQCIDSHWSYSMTLHRAFIGVISVIDNTSKPNMPAVSYTHSLTIHLYTVSWCIRISYGPKYNYICNMESTIPNQTRQTVYEFDANKFYYLNWSVTVTRLPPDSCLKKKNYHLIVITFGICWTVHLIGSMHFTWYTMHAT